MDNENKKLQVQIEELKKAVNLLTRRVTILESENKKLKSRVIVASSNFSTLKDQLQRRGL